MKFSREENILDRNRSNMRTEGKKKLSIRLTRFFLLFVGFWKAESRKQQIWLNTALVYAFSMMFFAIAVETVDIYYCWGDFDAVTYNLCATMSLILGLMKLTICTYHRSLITELIRFNDYLFRGTAPNEYNDDVLRQCEKFSVLLIYTFSFLVNGTVFQYLLAPVIENIGKNETDRVLPFKYWLDLPITTTPYYEIIYIVQAFTTVHAGICFQCFDNLMCFLNIHCVGQFKVLQGRFENIFEKFSSPKWVEIEQGCPERSDMIVKETYDEFKNCVRQHSVLIDYVGRIEHVFTYVLMCQMLVSSLLLCLNGFQMFMASTAFFRKLIFVALGLASLIQLFVFTMTCGEIIIESENIGDAIYRSDWSQIPNQKVGKALKQGMLMVMVRSKRPCYLSAGSFCPMSLQTFTGILSTAISYFTLLRQVSEEID